MPCHSNNYPALFKVSILPQSYSERHPELVSGSPKIRSATEKKDNWRSFEGMPKQVRHDALNIVYTCLEGSHDSS